MDNTKTKASPHDNEKLKNGDSRATIKPLTKDEIKFICDLPVFYNMQRNAPGYLPKNNEEKELCLRLDPFLVATSNHNKVWAGETDNVEWRYYCEETTRVLLDMLNDNSVS